MAALWLYVEAHKAFVEVHKAQVELHSASVEPHSAKYTGMLSHIALCTQDVEVHRTLGTYRNPRNLLSGKVQTLSKHQYMD